MASYNDVRMSKVLDYVKTDKFKERREAIKDMQHRLNKLDIKEKVLRESRRN